MSAPSEPGRRIDVTRQSLREWPLPEARDSKYGRGQVVVVGGAPRSPGAAMLSGLAALRVGAGRLTLAVGRSVAAHVATAVPECGVVPLDETPGHSVSGFALSAASTDLKSADAVLLGPGLDSVDEATVMLRELPRFVSEEAVVVLDAFGLGAAPGVTGLAQRLGGRLVLTPNRVEAALLLGRDLRDTGDPTADLAADLAEIADAYRAVVSCFGVITAPDAWSWHVAGGGPGLATSGSGDVLAGAIAGLAARGAMPEQSAVWGTFLHAAAGDRLAKDVAPLGYLASDLLVALPAVLAEMHPTD